MIKPCSSPGCCTLTYGDVCLGCMQKRAWVWSEQQDTGDAQTASADQPSAVGSQG